MRWLIFVLEDKMVCSGHISNWDYYIFIKNKYRVSQWWQTTVWKSLLVEENGIRCSIRFTLMRLKFKSTLMTIHLRHQFKAWWLLSLSNKFWICSIFLEHDEFAMSLMSGLCDFEPFSIWSSNYYTSVWHMIWLQFNQLFSVIIIEFCFIWAFLL